MNKAEARVRRKRKFGKRIPFSKKHKITPKQLLDKIKKGNNTMEKITEEEKQSILPEAIIDVTDLLNKCNQLLHNRFKPAPEYIKDYLRETSLNLSDLVDELTKKLKSKADSYRNGREERDIKEEGAEELVKTVSNVKKELSEEPELVKELDAWMQQTIKRSPKLSPEVIASNIKTLRVEDNSRLVASLDGIFFDANNSKFEIEIDGKMFGCTIEHKANIPTRVMRLHRID